MDIFGSRRDVVVQTACDNTVVFCREASGWSTKQFLGNFYTDDITLSCPYMLRGIERMALCSVFGIGFPAFASWRQEREVVDVWLGRSDCGYRSDDPA